MEYKYGKSKPAPVKVEVKKAEPVRAPSPKPAPKPEPESKEEKAIRERSEYVKRVADLRKKIGELAVASKSSGETSDSANSVRESLNSQLADAELAEQMRLKAIKL